MSKKLILKYHINLMNRQSIYNDISTSESGGQNMTDYFQLIDL